MGRGYNKWSAEEEAAVRKGIAKHGVGKWQTILKDPEFSTVLVRRTNKDLKDKWRYIITKGESQIGYKPVLNKIKKTSKHYDDSAAPTREGGDKDEFSQHEAPAIVHESSEDGDSDTLILRFDEHILDGRTNEKQPSSSARKQEHIPPPNFNRSSWEERRTVTADGNDNEQETDHNLADLGSMKAVVNAELMRLRQMRPEDAGAAVAAFEKAKAAIAEAEEAERKSVEAERAAEEAQSVVDGLKRRLEEKKARPAPKRGKRGYSKC